MHRDVVALLRKWTTAGQIGHEVARKSLTDEEIIPRLLLRVGRTTLLTQDRAIYDDHSPHRGYCLLVMPRNASPEQLDHLTRVVFRTVGFGTVAHRLGKTAYVSGGMIRWRQLRSSREQSRRLAR